MLKIQEIMNKMPLEQLKDITTILALYDYRIDVAITENVNSRQTYLIDFESVETELIEKYQIESFYDISSLFTKEFEKGKNILNDTMDVICNDETLEKVQVKQVLSWFEFFYGESNFPTNITVLDILDLQKNVYQY